MNKKLMNTSHRLLLTLISGHIYNVKIAVQKIRFLDKNVAEAIITANKYIHDCMVVIRCPSNEPQLGASGGFWPCSGILDKFTW